MNQREFLERCLAQSPENLRPQVPLAIRSAEDCFGIGTGDSIGKSFTLADIPKVIQLAGVLQRLAEQNREIYQSDPDILLAINPETIITSEELIKDITPPVRELRTTIFGGDAPPFPHDIEKAAAWLEKQAQEDAAAAQNEVQIDPATVPKLKNQLFNHAAALASVMPDSECSISIKKLSIHYMAKDGKTRTLPIFRGKLTAALSDVISKISASTNFSQADLLAFVLTGIEPALPCMRIRRGIARYPTVQVDFFRGLNRSESSSLIRNINSTLKPTKKDLKARHLELYNLVTQKGGVPTTGKMEFWERLRTEWNNINPERQYVSAKCIQISYNRILKSLRIKR